MFTTRKPRRTRKAMLLARAALAQVDAQPSRVWTAQDLECLAPVTLTGAALDALWLEVTAP